MVTESYPPTPFTDISSDGIVRITAAQQNVQRRSHCIYLEIESGKLLILLCIMSLFQLFLWYRYQLYLLYPVLFVLLGRCNPAYTGDPTPRTNLVIISVCLRLL